jgi:hypothetical protein
MCAAGRQIDAQPAGVGRAGADPLPPHRLGYGKHRGVIYRSVSRGAPGRPEQSVLDLDATEDPLHGHQEGRFFHGYYDCYCYLPLWIFCRPHLLAAKQRPANIDAAAGAAEAVARIVAQIRACWPGVRIRLRRDAGFAREALMT